VLRRACVELGFWTVATWLLREFPSLHRRGSGCVTQPIRRSARWALLHPRRIHDDASTTTHPRRRIHDDASTTTHSRRRIHDDVFTTTRSRARCNEGRNPFGTIAGVHACALERLLHVTFTFTARSSVTARCCHAVAQTRRVLSKQVRKKGPRHNNEPSDCVTERVERALGGKRVEMHGPITTRMRWFVK
jgi:hypothetical protein